MSRSELEDVKFSLNETSFALPKADAARPVTLSLRIQLASALNSLDDPKRAGELCGEVLEANPNHISAYKIWIDAALRGKDFSKAIELIENALVRFGDDVDLRLKKANALESTGRRDEAIALLQILRIEQPENYNLKLHLARKLMAAGKQSAADAVFLEVLGKDAKNREAWIGRLNVAAASGDHHSVADKAERALEYLPKDDVLIIRAGQAMAKTGRIVEGVELLRETIAGSSAPSVNIRLAFAGLLQETGELQEADNIIQMVLTEQPENPAALNRYVGTALTRGDVDAGLTRCENALKKLPDNMPLMRRKAMLQRQGGRLDDAINLLQTMLRTDPNDGVSGIELARTLMMKKDFDSAEVIFVDVLKRHPSNRAALLGQVAIAEARGDLELAMALLEQTHDPRCKMTQPSIELELADNAKGGLQDPELLVRLLRLALRAGDDWRIAAVLPCIVELLPKLNDQNLIWLLAPSAREDIAELAVHGVREIATRDTISQKLAAAILRIAHISEDQDLCDRIESTLLQRLPAGQRNLFLMQTASVRAGPQRALQIARGNRNSERMPTEALELGRMLIAAGESFLALRYLRRCLVKWPNNKKLSELLIRTHSMTGQAETALVLLDAAENLQASPNPDPLRISVLLELGSTELALDGLLAQEVSTLGQGPLQQLAQLHMAVGNMAECERLMRMATRNKAGTRKKNYHFQISHLGQMLNEWKILEKVRADSTITSSSRDLAAIYFNEAKRVLNEAAGDLAKPPQHGTHQVIPRQIWQYWNTPEMPDEIELAIDSWRGQAGWKHRRLTHSDAVAWLRDAFDEEHARAFQLANHIAEGADFLRLCLLLAEGGIYADADDKRTGCLDALVAESSGVLLFREANGAISNNFICAAPGHPVMARAVNMARNSLLRRENDSTWSKTGPGLLTRAAALHFIDDPDAAIRDTRILRQNLSRRFVHPHLAIAYKSTPSYWNAQSDEISARMRLALINLVRSKGCTANFGVA